MTSLQPNNVLVAILKEPADFLYAVRESWYRVPLKNSPRVITENKAKYIGFYQNLKFKNAPSRIEYFAEIKNVQQVFRKDLIPDSPPSNANELYLRINIGKLALLPQPIFNLRGRRIPPFIGTCEQKFFTASDINQLYNNSPLENILQERLLVENIYAEREFEVKTRNKSYFLDFAFLCKNGNFGVECDGNLFHNSEQQIEYDKSRDRKLFLSDWDLMRFTTSNLTTDMENTVNEIKKAVYKYGGIIDPRTGNTQFPNTNWNGQISLF